MGKHSIFWKIIFYFLILLGLTGMFCTGIYIFGHSVIKNEMTQLITERNSSTAENIYSACQQIRLMEYQFSDRDDYIDWILADKKGDEMQVKAAIQNLQASLAMIWKGNSILEEVTLLSLGMDTALTTGSQRKLSEEDRGLLDVFGADQYSGDLFLYNGKLVIVTECMFKEYVICAELNVESLKREFFATKSGEDSESFLYNVKAEKAAQAVSDEILALVVDGGYEEALEKPVTRNNYLYQVTSIPRSDYIYVTTYPTASVYGKLKGFRYFFVSLLLLMVAGCIFFIRQLSMLLRKPLYVLMDGLEEVRKGNLDTEISIEREDEFQKIYQSFNRMTAQLKQLIEKTYHQEILLQKSELKQLQAQIAPHFLYNSFIVLSNRIHAEDYEFASEFSRELGQYFMFLTRNGKEYLPLKDELNHAKVYARIQHVRFRNRIELVLDDLDPAWETVLVPRLIIQPVFENVFKYVVEKSREMVTLHMGFSYEEAAIRIIIENSGDISAEDLLAIDKSLGRVDDEIHGMANIHQRLQLIYNGEGGITLERSELGGLKVILALRKEIPEGEDNVSDITRR